MEFQYDLKVPKDRLPMLIGKDGSTKKHIEEQTKTVMLIDSNEGTVIVKGEDAIGLLNAREVIKAIARGFNPDVAQLLLKGDYALEVLNIMDYTNTKSSLDRLRGRVIGKEGKSRGIIEELTESYISVYGKTISLIGQPQNVAVARRAVQSLLTGSPHANVYKWLEKQRRKLMQPTDL